MERKKELEKVRKKQASKLYVYFYVNKNFQRIWNHSFMTDSNNSKIYK